VHYKCNLHNGVLKIRTLEIKNIMSITIPVQKIESIEVAEYLKRGFEVYKSNLGILIPAFIVATLISFVTLGILAGPMMAGYIKVCARLSKPTPGEESPKIGDIFEGFNVFVPSLLLIIAFIIISIVINLVLGLFGSLGTILDVVVSVFIGGLVGAIALPLIAFEKSESISEVITVMIDTLKAGPAPLFLLFLASGLLGYAGIIAFGIGLIATLPYTFCVNSILFNDLFRSEEEEVTIM
jgi:hypothetical protein